MRNKYLLAVLLLVAIIAGFFYYNHYLNEISPNVPPEDNVTGTTDPEELTEEETPTLLTGDYCIFDYSDYPNKGEEAKAFFDFCEEKIPVIAASLSTTIDRKVNLRFAEEGLASTSGDTISLIKTWSINKPGVLLHEGVHFIQNYGIKAYGRGWITEGLADLVRFKLTKTADEPGWAIGCQGNEDYTFGYGCAAAFFFWMEDYCNYDDIQVPLNQMIVDLRGTDVTMNDMCGKDTEELWNIYEATSPPKRIYPID
jgi:hypothetical protein